MNSTYPQGAGLGFRRELIPELEASFPKTIEFFEVAPENWMGIGGRSAKQLRRFTERYPFVCHGLSLSLGGPTELDEALLRAIKAFMTEHGIALYTEHLSWCSDDGHLYDLLPIPLTEEAVHWTAERIKRTQDILGMRIGLENASYYVVPPGAEMSEQEFINAVISESDCLLHLDVNNLYVNSNNFGFDARSFLEAMPLERTCYIHVAGHYKETDGFLIDTHGSKVIDPVWSLLNAAYQRSGPVPTCLERDFNIPSINELAHEIELIKCIQAPFRATGYAA